MVVAQKFSEGKSFECPVCHKEIKNPSDIRKIYLFTIAYEIFNEKT